MCPAVLSALATQDAVALLHTRTTGTSTMSQQCAAAPQEPLNSLPTSQVNAHCRALLGGQAPWTTLSCTKSAGAHIPPDAQPNSPLEKLLHPKGCQAVEQAAQSSGGVTVPGEI